jgi:hypothetical protein
VRFVRVHAVHPELLALARERGLDYPELVERTRQAIQGIGTPDVCICTCSTLGPLAEASAHQLPFPVLRVDRPLAAAAVARGRRIGVVAALESTLAPTRALLEEEAARAGRTVELVERPCLDAWAFFERGELDRYHEAIAQHVDRISDGLDVVVLAQASMAPAAALAAHPDRCLSSPALAVAEAFRILGAPAPGT